ncbi:MAG: Rrf2 family transcriptional regulator [Chloroflexi bacterium]|nr:Rrf2 family transcriptional regulator [Chloroflexota bacterium]
MRLSAKERTALRAMAELARRYGQGPISLTAVAATEGLPLPYLERVATDLRKAGLVVSVRGARGGYYLARPPEDISIADIMRAVENPVMLIDCAPERGQARCHEVGCAAHQVLQVISSHLEQALDRQTLAAIISDLDQNREEPAIC